MPAEVIMPALGMAQETGKVLRWLKADGEPVAKGEPLLEVETDKVTVEIEAPADGTLTGLTVPEGAEVPVGSVIALVLAEGEELAALPEPVPVPVAEVAQAATAVAAVPAAPQESLGRRLASPKARRLAELRGIDLAVVAGTGPGGAVVAADVESAGASPALATGSVWRLMAERMTRAWQQVPQFVLAREVDARRLVRRDDGVSVTDLLIEASARALARHPRLTASWRDGALAAGGGVNVGVAVATAEALVVPVISDADRLSLVEISARRRELAEAARAGTLRPEDVQGGTFTISNLGMYGVDAFQAIVNPPQAAILAVGRIVERPVAVDGAVAARPVLTLTLSFDHRVVDGARGAEFLDTLASLVETGEEA
ncbi:MAG TPA: dihydrolipoamide acetyltransferase family protein [Gaiellaceae bacterium]|nr:dihydrolipoamide acetyltransferase family protein [Gaiellaceae bacterium]